MKILAILITLGLANVAMAAQEVKVEVHGLVCDFCAQGLEKTMDKVDIIEDFAIDMDTSIMTLTTADNVQLDDAAITKLVEDAGYSVGTIER